MIETLAIAKEGIWKMKLSNILHIGIINTLRINLKYFGVRGVVHPYIFAARKLKIQRLGGKLEIENPSIGCVKLGFPSVAIFDYRYDRSFWNNTGRIVFNEKANMYAGFRILNSGTISCGEDFAISGHSTIVCADAITFGRNNLLSWDVLIIDTDVHHVLDIDENVVNSPKPIIFGNNIWIGCRSLILKGTQIRDNCVIAAASIISGKCTESDAIIGDKLEIIKKGIHWKR